MTTIFEARNLVFKVRDGEVKWGDPVWWWCQDTGPELVQTDWDWEHTWENLKDFPECHSIEKPASFLDEATGLYIYPD